MLEARISLAEDLRQSYTDAARELAEWRLAEYQLRGASSEPTVSEHVVAPAGQLTLWREYMREQIPGLFGLEFAPNRWRQGFVWIADKMFLLVTLDKRGKPKEHQYTDRFLGPDLFEWQSQNQHSRDSRVGRAIRSHREKGISVYLFVRPKRLRNGRAAPFTYCGPVGFEDWDGDRPITVRWRLQEPVPDALRERLGLLRGEDDAS